MSRLIFAAVALCALTGYVHAGEFDDGEDNRVLVRATPLPDEVLESYRGGFVLPDGTEVDLALTVVHRIDGRPVTRQRLGTMDILRNNGVVNRLAVRDGGDGRSVTSEVVSANPAGGLRNVTRNSANGIRLENAARLDVRLSGGNNLADVARRSLSRSGLTVEVK